MSRVLPILFNTDMVRAILDGRKTVTRRVVKPANPFRNKEGYCQGNGLWIDGYSKDDEPNGHIKDYSVSSCWWPKRSYIEKYAPYQPGDILYVRETWAELSFGYAYKSDGENIDHLGNLIKWHPSIHMPKEAARIWLKVTDVRVERLQEITPDQICREGIEVEYPHILNGEEKIYAFSQLWISAIKKSDLDRYGWDANPFIWVIEFERCENPAGWGV